MGTPPPSGSRRLFRLAAALSLVLVLEAHASEPTKPERGIASFYGWGHAGAKMASGKPFRPLGATAAHRTLPLGTKVIITNLRNGKTARATIEDRGPYVAHRSIDVSLGVARRLSMEHDGLAPVSIKPVGRSAKTHPSSARISHRRRGGHARA